MGVKQTSYIYFIIIKGWGGRWEGGSGLGTHVHLWLIHVNVWQNQYSIVKQSKVKIKIKKKNFHYGNFHTHSETVY